MMKSIIFSFLFAGVAGLASPVSAGLFNPDVFTLDNGLEVVVLEDHRAPVVTQMIWYKVGAADEPVGKSGIAHFLEHLMFKGTHAAPGKTFSQTVAASGGRENAFTAHDFTGYFQTLAAHNLEQVMKLEADRMTNLTLTKKDIVSERDVVLEERRSRTDNEPSALLREQTSAVQFLTMPYRIPVVGWAHEIKQLNREDALAFYRQYYAPNNAILVIAGDVTTAGVKKLAQKYYGVIPRGEVTSRNWPTEPPQLSPRRVELRDQRVRQPSWRRTYLAPGSRSDKKNLAEPLDLLSQILGGGTTSRLYQSLVVEQKIAASAGSWFSGDSVGPSRFGFYARPVPGGKLPELETSIDAEIRKILEHGVTEAELNRAKAGMQAMAVYARDSVTTKARIFGRALAIGHSIEDVETWPLRVEAVTAKQVQDAAREVLDLRRSVTGLLLPEKKG
jgi:zinc protease